MSSIKDKIKSQIDKAKLCLEKLKRLNVSKKLLLMCARLIQVLSAIYIAKKASEIPALVDKSKYWLERIREYQKRNPKFVPSPNNYFVKHQTNIVSNIIKILISSTIFVIQQITVSLIKRSEISTISDISREDSGENIMAYISRKRYIDRAMVRSIRHNDGLKDIAIKIKEKAKELAKRIAGTGNTADKICRVLFAVISSIGALFAAGSAAQALLSIKKLKQETSDLKNLSEKWQFDSIDARADMAKGDIVSKATLRVIIALLATLTANGTLGLIKAKFGAGDDLDRGAERN